MARPDLPLKEATFIAFDTETTGLYPVVGGLVEIGAVRFGLEGEDIAVFEHLINPQMQIPPEAQMVNGISDQMVEDQPPAQLVLPAFMDFLGGLHQILVAHNAAFDVEFVGVGMIRLGLPLPGHLVFDTMLLAQTISPGLPSYGLESLAAMLGVGRAQVHRALSDARLTKEVFRALIRRVPQIITVADLAKLAPPLSFAQSRTYRMDPPAGFEALAAAIEQGQPVEMVYEGGSRAGQPQRITPRALLQYAGYGYLAAHCHLDGKEKIYRLDRIRSYHLPG